MQNKIFIIIIFFIFCLSCTKKISLSQKGDLKKIDQLLNRDKVSKKGRRIAETKAGSCFSNSLSEESILEEIRALENKSAIGSKMIINGLNLSKFPAAQASFIESKREWIYTQNLDLQNCSDVKCVFSKMYPATNGFEGYLYYYFYLKMGYALSTVNTIPGENLLGISYQDVLFSPEELVSFYFLAKILPAKFQRLSTLARIHRMPRGTHLTNNPEACGLAGGPFNKGYIIMLDECLKRYPDTASGPFFPTLTHELSHHLDNVLVNNIYGFSETPDWLNFSGWVRKENFDPVTNKIKIEWVLKDSTDDQGLRDGFTSSYAKTNPGEDFADSIGYFRFNPEVMQKNSPRKFDWISKNVFGGKFFTSEGIKISYQEQLHTNIIGNLPAIIEGCVARKEESAVLLESKVLNDYNKFDPELIKCVFGDLEKSFYNEIANLRSTELEACDYFEQNENELKLNVMQGLDEFIKKDLGKNAKLENQLKILAELISTLNEDLDPREIFVACLENSDAENCFTQKLENDFDKIASRFTQDIPYQSKILREDYLKANRFLVTKENVVDLFNQIFLGAESKFKDEAKRKWNVCFLNSSDNSDNSIEEGLLLNPFNGGTFYIKKYLINCLNRSATDDLNNVLDKIGKKLSISISNSATKKFILNLYINNYTSLLQKYVENESLMEEKIFIDLQENIKQKIMITLKTNTGWIGNALFEDSIQNSCLLQVEQNIKDELATNFKKQVDSIKFHTFNEGDWQDQICKSVVSSLEVKNVIVSNQSQKIEGALAGLKERLIKNTQEDADTCKNKYTSKLMRKMRNLCLTNSMKWNEIVESTLVEWLTDEQLGSIPGAKEKGLDFLKKNKSDLQEKSLAQMNIGS